MKIHNMLENFPTKLVGGIVLLAVLGIGAYFFLGIGQPAEPNTLQTASSTPGSTAGGEEQINTEEILVQLNRLRGININTDMFNSEAFLSLKDFSVTITDQPIGRENPFIPSTYVPSGSTIVPNSDPANPQPLDMLEDGATSSEESATSSDESDDTEQATTTNDNEADQGDETATTTDEATTTEEVSGN